MPPCAPAYAGWAAFAVCTDHRLAFMSVVLTIEHAE